MTSIINYADMNCGTSLLISGLMLFGPLLCALQSNTALAQTVAVATPTPVPLSFTARLWPETFFQSAMSQSEQLQYRFTNALFNGEGNNLFNDGFNSDGNFTVKMNRDIFNNFDLLNTWTVIDRLIIKLQVPVIDIGVEAPTGRLSEESISFPFFSVNFGVGGALELKDMRQVSPREVQNSAALASAAEQSPDTVQEINPYLRSSALDSPLRVKINDILNPILIPFKIPFSRREFSQMNRGEMISYTVSGQVGFGGTFGWTLLPSDVLRIGPSAKVETHLDGEFEISVFKESDRFAKVCITKIKGHGNSESVSMGLELKDFYKGFFLFKNTAIESRAGNVSASIVPFEFQMIHEASQEIDVGYRYDLDSARGRDAYYKAVLGSFTQSDSIANDEASSVAPTVSKIFTRKSARTNNTHSSGFNLSIFMKRDRTRGTENLVTEVTLPDGKTEIFRSVESDTLNSNGFFRNYEDNSHKLTVMVDQEGFAHHRENSIMIMSENMREDSSTHASELNAYTSEIQTALHEPGLFPVFPDKIPVENHPGRLRRAQYGRSSFYYGYSIKEEGIANFLNTEWSELETLAKSLGAKFDRTAFIAARTAFQSRDSLKAYQSLTELFKNRAQMRQLSELLVSTIDSSLYEKFLVAQNPTFGSIQSRGHHLISAEDALRRTEQETGVGGDLNSPTDTEVGASNLKTEITPEQKVKLSFDLTTEPEFLYFRVKPETAHSSRKDAVELIVSNQNHRFKVGNNSLTLDAESPDLLEHDLAAKLESEEIVVTTLGISSHASQWGTSNSIQFKTP